MRTYSKYERKLLDDIHTLEKENKLLSLGVKNAHNYYLNVDDWNEKTDDELDNKLTDLFIAMAIVRNQDC